MKAELQKLVALQNLDTSIRKLEKDLEAIPERRAEIEKEFDQRASEIRVVETRRDDARHERARLRIARDPLPTAHHPGPVVDGIDLVPAPAELRAGRLGDARLGVDQAMAGHEARGRLAADRRDAALREAGGVEVGRADPQAHAPSLGQPLRVADVVRVHVRDDHAQHRQAIEVVREDPLPGGGIFSV